MIMVLLICFTGYGQQSYAFDYVMEYEIEHLTEKGSPKSSHYCFMSSTKSSYMMIVNEMGKEVGMTLVLAGGKYYYGTIAKDDFFVEAISLKCPRSGTFAQTEKVRDFELVPKNDTVIDKRSFSHVVLKPVNRRKTENREIFTKHYIMDNSLYLNFPSLPPDDIGYRFWEEKEKMPNGILKECNVTDEKGKVITRTRLVQFIKLKKLIMVDKNCK
ncbi:hypothetical protein [Flavobacterium album]|nr:hypothetical protein [Flavobacterium album]